MRQFLATLARAIALVLLCGVALQFYFALRIALMIVVDGPQKAGDTVWWKVSGPEQEGWCAADALALVSR